MSVAVNQEQCTKCGACAKVCPLGIITFEDGYPSMMADKEDICLDCQHCVMACHTAALSLNGVSAGEKAVQSGISPEALSALIKSRRTIRAYKKENVDKALVKSMIDQTNFAPSGHNDGKILYTVVDDRQEIEKLQTAVKKALRKCVDERSLPAGIEFVYDFFETYLNGNDVLFRGAPHLLVTSSAKTNITAEVDGIIAMSYFDIIAAGNGVGTCWNGLIKFILDVIAPEIKLAMGIPENYVTGYVMVFGYPDERYYSLPDRGKADLRTVSL